MRLVDLASAIIRLALSLGDALGLVEVATARSRSASNSTPSRLPANSAKLAGP